MARPSEYRQEMVELGRNYCLLGATDDDMARFFDVDVRSIHRWKLDHPEFAQALREGKEEADAKVARRLYERATGYSHPEDKIFNNEGEPLVVSTTKHYPPDPVACIFCLKNRQKARWRDKQEIDHGVTSDLAAILKVIDGKTRGLPAQGPSSFGDSD